MGELIFNKLPLIYVSLGILLQVSPLAQATIEGTTALGSEKVPMVLYKGALACHDRLPDLGFGSVPARLDILENKIFDRTLRLAGVGIFTAEPPDTATCASLASQISAVPEDLIAVRSLRRDLQLMPDKKHVINQINVNLSLTIPVILDGKPVALTGSLHWSETNALATDPNGKIRPLPFHTAYTANSHPQSGSQGYGLFCLPTFNGSTTYELSFGGFAGYNDMGGSHGNTDVVKKPFANQADCEDILAELSFFYQASDPGKWGTIFRVDRNLQLTLRYILDNMAKSNCQEIEMETVMVRAEGHVFRAAKSFPLMTVDMKECWADRLAQH